MNITSKTLGYFLADYISNENGVSATSLETLISEGHKDGLPFLDNDKIKQLQSAGGINKREIRTIPNSTQGRIGRSATTSFLYEMLENGRSSEIGIPKDNIFITTNRKTIMKILQLLRTDDPGELLLTTKLRAREYGKELRIRYSNDKDQQFFWDRIAKHQSFGLKFNSYLVNDEGKSGNDLKSSFLSIHRLDIGDTCFVYEAEIDGIQRDDTVSENESEYSIVEVKTYDQEEAAVRAFYQYRKLQQKMNESNQSVNAKENLRMRDEFVKANPEVFIPLLQGELGNVDKYVYGIMGSYKITAKEFPCYPGVLLQYELQYLLDFVELLKRNNACSFGNGVSWDDWHKWRITKDKHSMKLWHETELLAELEMRSVVGS